MNETITKATAVQELEDLKRAEQELKKRLKALNAEKRKATEARGARVLAAALAGKDPGPPDPRLAEIEGELAGADQALELLERRRKDATRRGGYEKVAALRTEAANLTAEAEQREAKTAALLAELEEFEGCPFHTPGHRWTGLEVPSTKTEALRNDARKARGKADSLERELDLGPAIAEEYRREEERWAEVYPPEGCTPWSS